jgi:membrane-associated phospholipid phosphatase
MFNSMFLPGNYNYWMVAIELLVYLLLFTVVVSLVFFLLRRPMRQYKPTDLELFKKLEGLRTEKMNRLMLFLTYLGKHYFLVPANLLLIGGFLVLGGNSWFALRIFLLSASSFVLMFFLKRVFRRNRPQQPLLYAARGMSFPSGHAIMAVNFYGLVLYMIWHTGIDPGYKIAVAILMVLLILGIGFSRIYLQVHYTSDVLAGFLIGICWFYTCLQLLSRLEMLLRG